MLKRYGLLLILCLIFVAGCHDKKRHRGSAEQYGPTSGSGGSGNGGGGGSNGGGNDPTSWPPSDCDYSAVDESWWPAEDSVWYFNSKFYNNQTMRWKNGAIKVKVLDSRVDLATLQTILDELNELIAPANLMIFNGPVNNADIVIDFAGDLITNTGYATWQVNLNNHRIVSASIELAEFSGNDCYFYAILKHHLIRTIGFFDYTQDGGVMAEEFYNDHITALVEETLIALYDLSPGSVVGSNGPE